MYFHSFYGQIALYILFYIFSYISTAKASKHERNKI